MFLGLSESAQEFLPNVSSRDCACECQVSRNPNICTFGHWDTKVLLTSNHIFIAVWKPQRHFHCQKLFYFTFSIISICQTNVYIAQINKPIDVGTRGHWGTCPPRFCKKQRSALFNFRKCPIFSRRKLPLEVLCPQI